MRKLIDKALTIVEGKSKSDELNNSNSVDMFLYCNAHSSYSDSNFHIREANAGRLEAEEDFFEVNTSVQLSAEGNMGHDAKNVPGLVETGQDSGTETVECRQSTSHRQGESISEFKLILTNLTGSFKRKLCYRLSHFSSGTI